MRENIIKVAHITVCHYNVSQKIVKAGCMVCLMLNVLLEEFARGEEKEERGGDKM